MRDIYGSVIRIMRSYFILFFREKLVYELEHEGKRKKKKQLIHAYTFVHKITNSSATTNVFRSLNNLLQLCCLSYLCKLKCFQTIRGIDKSSRR